MKSRVLTDVPSFPVLVLSSTSAVGRRRLELAQRDDRDAGGSEDALTQPVTRLEHLGARRLGDVSGVAVRHRLVQRRVERLTGRPVALEAELRQRRLEIVRDRLDATVELAVLARAIDV